MSVFVNNALNATEFLLSLRRVLSYDPGSGDFVWLVQPRRKDNRKGQVAGKVSSTTGYRMIGIKGRTYPAHRLAWLFTYGDWPAGYIDHINGNRLDNRLANLRDTTNSSNNCNKSRPRSDNKGLPLGVQFNSGKYSAKIKVHDRQVYLGRFATAREAGLALDRDCHAATNERLGLI